MGFVFLGLASLTAIGFTGAVVVMIAHGFLAALSFAVAGYVRQQAGTLEIGRLGGMLRRLPFIGSVLLMAAFAGCGLPGFANFAGEITVLFGAWQPFPLVTALACWGALIIGAIYMLRAVRRMLHGPMSPVTASMADSPDAWRKAPFAVLLAALVFFGCFPGVLTSRIAPDAAKVAEMTHQSGGSLPRPATMQQAAVSPTAR